MGEYDPHDRVKDFQQANHICIFVLEGTINHHFGPCQDVGLVYIPKDGELTQILACK